MPGEGTAFNEPLDIQCVDEVQKKTPDGQEFLGEHDGIRTHDPQNHNLML
jgi:hypothetical protein